MRAVIVAPFVAVFAAGCPGVPQIPETTGDTGTTGGTVPDPCASGWTVSLEVLGALTGGGLFECAYVEITDFDHYGLTDAQGHGSFCATDLPAVDVIVTCGDAGDTYVRIERATMDRLRSAGARFPVPVLSNVERAEMGLESPTVGEVDAFVAALDEDGARIADVAPSAGTATLTEIGGWPLLTSVPLGAPIELPGACEGTGAQPDTDGIGAVPVVVAFVCAP